MPINDFGQKLKNKLLVAAEEQYGANVVTPDNISEYYTSAFGAALEDYLNNPPEQPKWDPDLPIQTYTINPAQAQRRSVVELRWIQSLDEGVAVSEYSIFRSDQDVINDTIWGAYQNVGSIAAELQLYL